MNTHKIKLNSYCATSIGGPIYLGTAGSHGNEQLQVIRENGWDNLAVQVVFYPCKVAIQLPADGLLEVPWEATAYPLSTREGRIVFQGFDLDHLINSADLYYTVSEHSIAIGRDEQPYTPGIVESVLNKMTVDKAEILAATDAADRAQKDAAVSAETARANADQAAVQVAAARQNADAAKLAQTQAANSAADAADHEAAASETLRQVKYAAQQAVQKVEEANIKAMENITSAASALPSVSSAVAWQAVTVKQDGSSYTLSELAPISAGVCPTVSGNPVVCKHSAAWKIQGMSIYGKSTQNGVPSPDRPVAITNTGDSGSIVLSVADGVDQYQFITISTLNGLPGIPIKSGGNFMDAEGQQWLCCYKDYVDGKIYFPVKKYVASNLNFVINQTWTAANPNYAFAYVVFAKSKPVPYAMSNAFKSIEHTTNYVSINQPVIMVETSHGYSVVYFSILKSNLNDISAESVKNYMSSISAEFIAANDKPDETSDIPPEEVAAYCALTTYDGNTVISVPEEVVGLEVQYLANSTSYLQEVSDRIEALEAAQKRVETTSV